MTSETIIKDSQIRGLSSLRTSIGYCCCKIIRKGGKYNLKDTDSTVNIVQNTSKDHERRERNQVLEKIAKTLPTTSTPQNSHAQLQTITQSTPSRSTITKQYPSAQSSRTIVTSKTNTSHILNSQQPHPAQQQPALTSSQFTKTKDPDETSTGK
ncbi:unnamed protein product [Didymodactylos carnosus]|uniref:Uncharacterized protein n=1 Tax=Didymodactylos carnosus TaxID=1234261 RepID=A0A813WHT4_9BILA|nr:unnamed protein product [Didymodactylos carnosus]CAF3643305.1 unnamed protein product [Didymodactylos carnosus]